MYDYLVVGAGFFGATFARTMADNGARILVVDRRNHVGGNCYTEWRHGVNVHLYGPHIFHTNSEKVWKFVNRYSKFNAYIHRVKANFEGCLYSLPINLMTMHQIWGVTTVAEAERKLTQSKISGADDGSIEGWCLANIGMELYEKLIKGYTKKHWRRDPKNLPSSIVRRLPVRFNHDDRYFSDKYQGIPIEGYTPLFERMLDGIEIKLQEEFDQRHWRKIARKLVYSGRIDSLVSMKFGELPYLTLSFSFSEHERDVQGTSIINETSEKVSYTRTVEHRHFLPDVAASRSIITREYPKEWSSDEEPYYPIPGQNSALEKYRAKLACEKDIIVGGRLGKYQYLDMHQVIASALSAADKEVGR